MAPLIDLNMIVFVTFGTLYIYIYIYICIYIYAAVSATHAAQVPGKQAKVLTKGKEG